MEKLIFVKCFNNTLSRQRFYLGIDYLQKKEVIPVCLSRTDQEKEVRMRELVTLHVNGERHEVAVLPHHTLLEVLREDLGLIGTKHGCELGECGACTVLIDDLPVLSCLTLPVEVQNSEITTIEGLEKNGKLHPLQETFAELGAAQCGYCTPGILLAGVALLQEHPHPTREQMKEALAGNLCRCTGYTKIYEAVDAAAERLHAAGVVSRPSKNILAQVL